MILGPYELGKIHEGDCLELMKALPENSVDAVVTDPPYELGFMGKRWDKAGVSFRPETWAAVLRVMKPGAHLLAFGGTRTYHRIACAIEDAGFEVRDMIQWLYGSGFPKNRDVSKALDKAARRDYVQAAIQLGMAMPDKNRWDWTKGEHSPSDKWWEKFKTHLTTEQWGIIEREFVGKKKAIPGVAFSSVGPSEVDITAPATDAAKKWAGWGTALKPANEPICLARKPISEKTISANVLRWGTGALNIEACRIDTAGRPAREGLGIGYGGEGHSRATGTTTEGRWPANVIMDEEAGAMLNEQSSDMTYGDFGGASRFFYCAKASRGERNAGLEGMSNKDGGHYAQDEWSREHMGDRPDAKRAPVKNHHPTVKPISLMRYLLKLVTPPGGIALDPFAGSGSTLCAAAIDGVDALGFEMDAEYMEIANARIAFWRSGLTPQEYAAGQGSIFA